MLTATAEDLKRRARRLARRIPGSRLEPGSSAVGGGSFPGSELPTTLVALDVPQCDAFLQALRQQDPPVVARATDQRVVLDVRTVQDSEITLVADAVRACGWSGNTGTASARSV
jgi:L-seryl-tRNA(Ser) seleniumtransferase